jgi:hypothetical protein
LKIHLDAVCLSIDPDEMIQKNGVECHLELFFFTGVNNSTEIMVSNWTMGLISLKVNTVPWLDWIPDD